MQKGEIMRALQAHVEGSKIAVAYQASEVPAGGLCLVPRYDALATAALYYRGARIGCVQPSGKKWLVEGARRPFPCLPSACFAAVTNHLISEGRHEPAR